MKKLILFRSSIILGALTTISCAWSMQSEAGKVPIQKLLADVINTFAGKSTAFEVKPYLEPVKLIEIADPATGTPYRFFGVNKNDQNRVNFTELKNALVKTLGVTSKTIYQFVGDSNQFSAAGTLFGRQFLRTQLEGSHIIEYGLTGHVSTHELDINALVNEYLNEKPDQAYRVIANVVGHSVIALEKWGCTASPHVRNFVVVYNDTGMDDGFSKFGDDVIMSDHLLNAADGDKFICLEGGAQSFSQITNALLQNIHVALVYNLRKPENKKFFSAAEFLSMVYANFSGDKAPTKETVRALYAEYEKTHEAWDPKRPDASTKAALFAEALNNFIDHDAYTHIKKCAAFENGTADFGDTSTGRTFRTSTKEYVQSLMDSFGLTLDPKAEISGFKKGQVLQAYKDRLLLPVNLADGTIVVLREASEPAAELTHMLDIQNYTFEHGFSTPKIYKTRDGKLFTQRDGRGFMIMQYIPGKQAPFVGASLKYRIQLAQKAAQLHNILKSKTAIEGTPLRLPVYEQFLRNQHDMHELIELLKKSEKSHSEVEQFLIDNAETILNSFADIHTKLPAEAMAKLPQQWLHGDYAAVNHLLDDSDTILSIIDYQPVMGPRPFDLMTGVDMREATRDGRKQALADLVAYYQLAAQEIGNPLSDDEIMAVPQLSRINLLRLISWLANSPNSEERLEKVAQAVAHDNRGQFGVYQLALQNLKAHYGTTDTPESFLALVKSEMIRLKEIFDQNKQR